MFDVGRHVSKVPTCDIDDYLTYSPFSACNDNESKQKLWCKVFSYVRSPLIRPNMPLRRLISSAIFLLVKERDQRVETRYPGVFTFYSSFVRR
jgi:hypothetical protein